jgi:hypothetical protein
LYEWENLALNDVAALLLNRDPRAFPWGMFMWERRMGGFAEFLWFASQDEMAEWFTRIDLTKGWLRDASQKRGEDSLTRVRQLLAPVLSGERTIADVLALLNVELAALGLFTIDWWGTFVDLCEGDEAFPKRVRAEFRGDAIGDDIPGAVDPISHHEADGFVEFLRGFAY